MAQNRAAGAGGADDEPQPIAAASTQFSQFSPAAAVAEYNTPMLLPRPCLLLLPLLLAAPALAQDRSTLETEAINTVLRFFDAALAVDEQALNDLIFVHEGQVAKRRGKELFIGTLIAQRQLEQAAIQRFGPSEGALLASGAQYTFSSEDREALNRAFILFDDGGPGVPIFGARIISDTFTTPLRLHRSSQGQWRVILEPIDRLDDEQWRAPPPPTADPDAAGSLPATRPIQRQPSLGAQLQLERFQAVLDAINSTRDRITNRQIPTANAACVEVAAKIAAANEEFQRKRSQYLRPQRFRQ